MYTAEDLNPQVQVGSTVTANTVIGQMYGGPHGIEIGWALHPDHWGKGFATEAGAAAVEYAFVHHYVDALYSVILPENTASQAVARRLGFTLWEQRVFSHFPETEHGIWRLQRTRT